MDTLREEVISNLRACLISTKGKCDLRTLREDYRMLMGEQIPYIKLGYKSLEDFICTVDTLTTCRAPSGEILVDAVSSQQTKHITDMINKQKGNKKKKMPSKSIKHVSFTNQQKRPPSKWRPKNIPMRIKSAYNSSPRPAAMSHNQFINYPKSQQKHHTLPPRYAQIKRNTIEKQQQQSDKSNNTNSNNNKSDFFDNRVVEVEYSDDNNSKCAALMNTKLRIVRKMSEFSMDSNSESSSSPVSSLNSSSDNGGSPSRETPPQWQKQSNTNGRKAIAASEAIAKNKIFEMTGDALVDLENFIRFRNLPEMILKMVERKTNKGRVILHECTIKVGNLSYSNYPTEFCDPEMSKQYTANVALEDLVNKFGRRRSLLLSNEKDILERIPPMIEKHTNGIWNTQLEADYSDMYNEQLPSNWLEIVDISSNVYVEPVLDKFILRYCQPGEVFQKGSKAYSPLVTDVSVPSNTVQFSENGELTAVITCAVSAGEIWCRQIGTPESEAFENMLTQLELIYDTHSANYKAEIVKEGGYFIAKSDDDTWLRVRVLDVTDYEVNCFCIDTGDEITVTQDQVYQLKREFAVEQAQVFVCRLAGLEELYEYSKNSEHIANLIGKTVMLEMHADENSKNDPTDPSFAVVMYDIEMQQYINQQLIDLISFEAAAPVLEKDITEVYITHVDDNGDIYVQVHSSGFEQLKLLLENLKNANLDMPVSTTQITPENSKNRLYLLKKRENNEWYRVKILDWAPNRRHAQIKYVDYGNCGVITLNDEILFPIDEISDVASHYPHQALRVRMVLEKVPPNFDVIFKRLIPQNTAVLLKNFGKSEDDVHLVDFFKRSEADKVLFSVTSALEMEIKKHGDGNNNNPSRTTKLQRLMSLNNIPSAGLLKPPPIPGVGDYFDVMVPFAVNPYNFFVQPYESNERLDRLMSALQARYKSGNGTPPQIDDIQPGKIYVSKHVDNLWYRTSVIKVIHAGSISVFYCDFGYYGNLTRQQLFPLDPEFAELPYQAIKARLVGIKPTQSKWTMEDCQYFQNLVCKKPFVSVLVSKEKDELYRSDMVLHLKLIDTTTSEDIYVHKILIDRGIATDC